MIKPQPPRGLAAAPPATVEGSKYSLLRSKYGAAGFVSTYFKMAVFLTRV
jgi:hypothetical protein